MKSEFTTEAQSHREEQLLEDQITRPNYLAHNELCIDCHRLFALGEEVDAVYDGCHWHHRECWGFRINESKAGLY